MGRPLQSVATRIFRGESPHLGISATHRFAGSDRPARRFAVVRDGPRVALTGTSRGSTMTQAVTAPSSQPSIHVPPGTVLGRRYRIDARIAEGGLGTVYRGWNLLLERQVAIKITRPERAHRAGAVERLMNEARAMARLRGIHTARVLDAGDIEGDLPYIVLEYL